MSACVLVSWAPEATEKSTRIPTPTNRLNSARGSHHTLPDRPRSTASRISRSLCKPRRIRPHETGQPISGRALRLAADAPSKEGRRTERRFDAVGVELKAYGEGFVDGR